MSIVQAIEPSFEKAVSENWAVIVRVFNRFSVSHFLALT
jgi:hypothetical protein